MYSLFDRHLTLVTPVCTMEQDYSDSRSIQRDHLSLLLVSSRTFRDCAKNRGEISLKDFKSNEDQLKHVKTSAMVLDIS